MVQDACVCALNQLGLYRAQDSQVRSLRPLLVRTLKVAQLFTSRRTLGDMRLVAPFSLSERIFTSQVTRSKAHSVAAFPHDVANTRLVAERGEEPQAFGKQ